MSAALKDGGSAFPQIDSIEGQVVGSTGGMSLRDWFASEAVAGGFARSNAPDYDLIAMFGKNRTGITREEIIAADAYRIADAMLRRRALTSGAPGNE